MNTKQKEYNLYDWYESFEYFQNLDYLPSYYFMNWNNWNVNDGKLEVDEGWKTHIVLHDIEEAILATQLFLPYLREASIHHKIVHPTKVQKFNEDPIQNGKILTIYDPELSFLKFLPKESIDFLHTPSNIIIPTDKQLWSRLFVRYTGYSQDKVYNPNTNEYEFIPREPGFYKPLWVPELTKEMLY